MYVKMAEHSTLWTYGIPLMTTLTSCCGCALDATLSAPSIPSYDTSSLLDYLEACIHELTQVLPLASIILAGDFNQMANSEVLERTGLTQLIEQPTRCQHTRANFCVLPNCLQHCASCLVHHAIRSQGNRCIQYTTDHRAQDHYHKAVSSRYTDAACLQLPCFCSTFLLRLLNH